MEPNIVVLKDVFVRCNVIHLLKWYNDQKDAEKLFEFSEGS